jgi:ABC-type multidrug transport system permease subunit
MESSGQMIEAIQFSYNSMTWITWLVLIFGMMKSVQAYIKAYEDNETYEQMRLNPDKTGISQFYYAIIISILCVFIFFLPYLMR